MKLLAISPAMAPIANQTNTYEARARQQALKIATDKR